MQPRLCGGRGEEDREWEEKCPGVELLFLEARDGVTCITLSLLLP